MSEKQGLRYQGALEQRQINMMAFRFFGVYVYARNPESDPVEDSMIQGGGPISYEASDVA